jgi:hypothetical protein
MNHVYRTYAVILPILCVGGALVLAGWGFTVILRRYLGVSSGKAVLIFVLSLMAGVCAGVIRFHQPEIPTPIQRWSGSGDADAERFAAVFAGLLTALTLVFLIHLHSKWVAGRLGEAEKKPGLDGIRAWLSADNVVCVILISLLTWLSFDYSPFGVALLGLLALVAYPAMKSASAPPQSLPSPESTVTERQRVLNMLDSGKITASEGAELLSALSLSEKPRVSKPAAAPPQKLALIGALLLLIGFFLPWFSISPGAELQRAAARMGLPFDLGSAQMGVNLTSAGTVRVAGGDIQHGLGWLILFLGLAAAALPYFAVGLPVQTRQRATLGGLSIGAIVLLYLLTQNMRFVSIGILLAMIGYGLQFAGALQKEHFSGQMAE